MQRASRIDNDAGDLTFLGDFDVVYHGVVELYDDRILVYEKEDFDQDILEVKLSIQRDAVEDMFAKRVHSGQQNYRCGLVGLFGTFEESRGYERISFKFEYNHYKEFKQAVRQSWNG